MTPHQHRIQDQHQRPGSDQRQGRDGHHGLHPIRCAVCDADASVLVPVHLDGRLCYLCEPCFIAATG